ncbi:hypothetical protein MKEN_01041100 [Mycena kentingensis (nom. inval.)]|nr:hypothetical protein MKEN_01041100 [Mycena kentingensis (nom. inval.)]
MPAQPTLLPLRSTTTPRRHAPYRFTTPSRPGITQDEVDLHTRSSPRCYGDLGQISPKAPPEAYYEIRSQARLARDTLQRRMERRRTGALPMTPQPSDAYMLEHDPEARAVFLHAIGASEMLAEENASSIGVSAADVATTDVFASGIAAADAADVAAADVAAADVAAAAVSAADVDVAAADVAAFSANASIDENLVFPGLFPATFDDDPFVDSQRPTSSLPGQFLSSIASFKSYFIPGGPATQSSQAKAERELRQSLQTAKHDNMSLQLDLAHRENSNVWRRSCDFIVTVKNSRRKWDVKTWSDPKVKGNAEYVPTYGEVATLALARYGHIPGIPHRRGYLLYGPPRTGKTSTIYALAGALNLEIYSLVDDSFLQRAAGSIPQNSIFLIEGIAATLRRSAPRTVDAVFCRGILKTSSSRARRGPPESTSIRTYLFTYVPHDGTVNVWNSAGIARKGSNDVVFGFDEGVVVIKKTIIIRSQTKTNGDLGAFWTMSSLRMREIDEFLKLPIVQKHLLPHLSFKSAKELRQRVELLPTGPRWVAQTIKYAGFPTKRPIVLFYRNSLDCAQFLLRHPTLKNHIDFIPTMLTQGGERVHKEWINSNGAWQMQAIPAGRTVVGIVASSDKTNISVMNGDRVAHPFLLSLANIRSEVASKASSNAFIMTALLPVPKFLCAKKLRGIMEKRLLHQCLDIICGPLKLAARDGAPFSTSDGNLIMAHTPLVSYIVDTPEAADLSGVKGKTSHLTMASHKTFGDSVRHPERTGASTWDAICSLNARVSPDDVAAYQKAAKAHPNRLSGVHLPFWRDWPLSTDPSKFLTPEVLHHIHKAFFDHDFQWGRTILGDAEIDFRLSLLHPRSGSRHFQDGRGFHELKHHIIEANGREQDHFNIPKLELLHSIVPSVRWAGVPMQYTADITEKAHSTQIKVPARTETNHRDYDPQIVRHLDRAEKLRLFTLYTNARAEQVELDLDNPDEGEDEEDATVPRIPCASPALSQIPHELLLPGRYASLFPGRAPGISPKPETGLWHLVVRERRRTTTVTTISIPVSTSTDEWISAEVLTEKFAHQGDRRAHRSILGTRREKDQQGARVRRGSHVPSPPHIQPLFSTYLVDTDVHSLAASYDIEVCKTVFSAFFLALREPHFRPNPHNSQVRPPLRRHRQPGYRFALFGVQGTDEVYFDELQALYDIRHLVAIAASNPEFPVAPQWTGRHAGGRHSYEDFHQQHLALASLTDAGKRCNKL